MNTLFQNLKGTVENAYLFPKNGSSKMVFMVSDESLAPEIYIKFVFTGANTATIKSETGFYYGDDEELSYTKTIPADWIVHLRVPVGTTELEIVGEIDDMSLTNNDILYFINFDGTRQISVNSSTNPNAKVYLDIDNLKNSNHLSKIYIEGQLNRIVGNIKSLSEYPLTKLAVRYTDIEGDIQYLPSTLTSLQIGGCTKIYGDIKDLKAYNLVDIHCYNTLIGGDLKAYLDNCVLHRTVSTPLTVYSGGLTYNYDLYVSFRVVFSNGTYTVERL